MIPPCSVCSEFFDRTGTAPPETDLHTGSDGSGPSGPCTVGQAAGQTPAVYGKMRRIAAASPAPHIGMPRHRWSISRKSIKSITEQKALADLVWPWYSDFPVRPQTGMSCGGEERTDANPPALRRRLMQLQSDSVLPRRARGDGCIRSPKDPKLSNRRRAQRIAAQQ